MSVSRFKPYQRRGDYWSPPPTVAAPVVVTAAPGYIAPNRPHGLRLARRGTIADVPPSTLPPGSPPTYQAANRTHQLRIRRGSFTDVPGVSANTGTQDAPPDYLRMQGIRPRLYAPPRRGDSWSPVAPPTNAGNQLVSPAFVAPSKRTRRIPNIRRGDYFSPPTVGNAPIAVTTQPQFLTSDNRRVPTARQGSFWNAPLVVNTAIPQDLPPEYLQRARAFQKLTRIARGDIFTYPVLEGAPRPDPILPPGPVGGSFSPSLGRRHFRAKRRAVKSGFSKT